MAPTFRYSERSKEPEGYLRGIFDAHTSSSNPWKTSRARHLELVGPILTVAQGREGKNTILRQDVRDLTFGLGKGPRELSLRLSNGLRLVLVARHLTHLATWMEALVAVVEAGCVRKFYQFALGIGSGRRGPVRLAWERSLTACGPVAIKEVNIDERRANTFIDMELARLCKEQENLLTVVDVFRTLTREYIVSEYARGGSLHDILRGRASASETIQGLGSMGDWSSEHLFTEEDVRVLILELLRGLKFLHDCGARVHGQVHPKNILLLRKARGDGGGHFGVRLKTFGLRPGSNRFATTPAPNLPESSEPESTSRFYLAPEDSKRNTAGWHEGDTPAHVSNKHCLVELFFPASHVIERRCALMALFIKPMYSVGVIMYQLLGNGTVPFRGSESEYLMSVSRGPEFRSGTSWDSVSVQARQLVTALLSQTGAERPSAGAVLRSAWAGGGAGKDHPVLARPPSAAALAVQLARSGKLPESDAMVRWKEG